MLGNKGAFVFRSLQFVLGNETFFEGLRELLRVCHYKECNLTDVQDVFENTSKRFGVVLQGVILHYQSPRLLREKLECRAEGWKILP